MPLKIERKLLILVIGLLMGAFLFQKFVYQPKKKKIPELQGEIESIGVQLDALSEIAATLPRVRSNYEEVKKKEGELETELLPEEEVAGIKEKLTQIARESKMHIRSINSLPVVDKMGKFKEVTIKMHIEGEYRQWANFLKRLNTLPRGLSIYQVNIERDEKIFPKIPGTVIFRAYFIPSPP